MKNVSGGSGREVSETFRGVLFQRFRVLQASQLGPECAFLFLRFSYFVSLPGV